MERHERWSRRRLRLAVVAALALAGCETPSAHTTSRNYGQRAEIPVDPPGAETGGQYDDCADGGRLFKLYCGSCHNARPLSERPLSNYEVVVAHMRDQAYLTGKEYRSIILFLRRWQDTGPPTPDVEPGPKRFTFSQPNAALRGQAPAAGPAPAPPPPPPGAAAAPFQPPGAPGANATPQPGLNLPAPIQ
jgi:hypothetical protein